MSEQSKTSAALTLKLPFKNIYGPLHEFACHPCARAMLSLYGSNFSLCAAEGSTPFKLSSPSFSHLKK